ncbi:MAG: 6-carboxytetrahydropterin synthase [Abditibacteriales bacterium]|nr:6-carboxytetrahydropterin synthase [Abditibacteriales bacterium]MDW8364961.1 6-carboxytetrahydropterin synthase [Abditibacteriales bacterium]
MPTAKRITRLYTFEAAHRIFGYNKASCGSLHGHSYRAEVTLEASELDEFGFVLDFNEMKKLQGWIDTHLDHATLVDERDERLRRFLAESGDRHFVLRGGTSAESIAEELRRQAVRLFESERVKVVSVRVNETGKCGAEVSVNGS